MAKGSQTRDRVVRTAATLFQKQGYHATGVNQVLTESGAPKGSLYFHFPGGKEQLACESVAFAGDQLAEGISAVVQAAPDARAAILRLAELLARNLEESGYSKGCPVATVALDAATESEPIRKTCDTTYTGWLDRLSAHLAERGVPDDRSEALAILVLSSLQGALLLARVRHDVAIIHRAALQVADLVGDAVPGSPKESDAP